MASNIGARGLPRIVGDRLEAATIDAKIVPSPKRFTIHRSLVVHRSHREEWPHRSVVLSHRRSSPGREHSVD